jgi:hypothetical protein
LFNLEFPKVNFSSFRSARRCIQYLNSRKHWE